MGDPEGESAIEQRQPEDREVGVHGDLIGAVPVEQERCGAVGAGRAGTIEIGTGCHRRRRPIRGPARSRPGRSRRAPAAACAGPARGGELVVEHRRRRDHRRVAEPARWGSRTRGCRRARRCRSARRRRTVVARHRRLDGSTRERGEPVAPQLDHEVPAEGVDTASRSPARGDHVRQSRGRGRPGPRRARSSGAVVVQDQEPVRPPRRVLDRVLDALRGGGRPDGLAVRLSASRIADLAWWSSTPTTMTTNGRCGCASTPTQNRSSVSCETSVVGARACRPVPPHPVGPPGLVDGRVEDGVPSGARSAP